MKRKRKKKQRNRQHMQRLRAKFLAQAKKYFGTPYAKRYWTPDDEEYYSKRFLDCCGLVRQVMLDLRKEFGFRIGPWNQAYMYDTLPVTIEREEDMKPGDLVFISGIYPNPKSRQQKHHMTHVEIWAGDGCKTIGARWNKGKVQVFDHYKFQPKSFHSEQYIFKSIDTWLAGTCKSHCPEHKWKRRKFNPSKKSVFSLGANKKDKPTNLEKGDQEKTDGQTEEEKTSGVTAEGEGQVEGTQWTEEEEGMGAEGSDGEEEQENFGQQDEDFDDDDDDEDEDDDNFLYEQGGDSQEDEDDINATPLGLQSQILSKNSSVASMQNYVSLSNSKTESSTQANQTTESIRKSDLAMEVSKCVIVDKNDKNLNNSASSSSMDSVFSKATNSMLKGRGSQQQSKEVKGQQQ